MHELSITEEILNIAIAKAREAKAEKVIQINLVIGDASSIVGECVQFCFDFVSKASIAEGAKLNFQRIPLQMKCRNCGCIFNPQRESWTCPQCGEWNVEIISGKEFYMESIEVD
jgi:hydrogenase nickel incorporation protein HypA/HybF